MLEVRKEQDGNKRKQTQRTTGETDNRSPNLIILLIMIIYILLVGKNDNFQAK